MTDDSDIYTEQQQQAIQACFAALTQYFTSDTDEDLTPYFEGTSTPEVVTFLFSQLVAAIRDLCKFTDLEPTDYLQIVALQFAHRFTTAHPST